MLFSIKGHAEAVKLLLRAGATKMNRNKVSSLIMKFQFGHPWPQLIYLQLTARQKSSGLRHRSRTYGGSGPPLVIGY